MKATKDHIMQRVSPYILEEQQQLLEIELKKLAGAKEEMKTTIEQSAVEAKQVAKAEAEKYVDQFKDRSSADQRSRLSTSSASPTWRRRSRSRRRSSETWNIAG